MAVTPYNPLDKENIGQDIARKLLDQPCRPLPDPRLRANSQAAKAEMFDGAGIYAIYYFGPFPQYARIRNSDGCDTPIYIGKAEPKGGRKGGLELDAAMGTSLYTRLKQHAKSIDEAANLNLSDFRCRYLVVDEVWIGLGERLAIRSHLQSVVWNTVIDGFGNHDPGGRRKDQYRSDWDVVHPGRKWADKLGQNPKPASQILAPVLQPPSPERLEELAAASIQEKNTAE